MASQGPSGTVRDQGWAGRGRGSGRDITGTVTPTPPARWERQHPLRDQRGCRGPLTPYSEFEAEAAGSGLDFGLDVVNSTGLRDPPRADGVEGRGCGESVAGRVGDRRSWLQSPRWAATRRRPRARPGPSCPTVPGRVPWGSPTAGSGGTGAWVQNRDRSGPRQSRCDTATGPISVRRRRPRSKLTPQLGRRLSQGAQGPAFHRRVPARRNQPVLSQETPSVVITRLSPSHAASRERPRATSRGRGRWSKVGASVGAATAISPSAQSR